MIDLQGYVTISAAARSAGVSRITIYRWIRDGKLEICQVPSGRTRVLLKSLLAAVPQNAEVPVGV